MKRAAPERQQKLSPGLNLTPPACATQLHVAEDKIRENLLFKAHLKQFDTSQRDLG